MTQEQIEHVFSVPDPARLILSNIRGSVDIQSGEENSIFVTAIKHLDTGDADHTEVTISQSADDTVTVRTRYQPKSRFLFPPRQPCTVDYTVYVPRACSLKVSGVSNTVTISGVTGDAEIKTISGPLALRKLQGPLKIESVSAAIKGEALSGPLRLKTVSGDVNLIESDFGEIKGATVSGDLTIQTQITGVYDLDSVSGDICLIVVPDTNCSVKVSTVSGDFISALPSSKTQHRRGERFYEIGSGGVQLDFNSISGDLSLRIADKVPAALQDEYNHDSQEIQSNVLDRLAQGELSAREALQELQA